MRSHVSKSLHPFRSRRALVLANPPTNRAWFRCCIKPITTATKIRPVTALHDEVLQCIDVDPDRKVDNDVGVFDSRQLNVASRRPTLVSQPPDETRGSLRNGVYWFKGRSELRILWCIERMSESGDIKFLKIWHKLRLSSHLRVALQCQNESGSNTQRCNRQP